MTDNPERPRKATQFRPGQSGNPAGRAKGSRNLLGEAFVSALHEDFQKHGKQVIARVRDERPQDYMKVVASILPKEVKVTNETDDMTDEQLSKRIRELATDLGFSLGEAHGADDADDRPKGPAGYN